ncbi:MAG: hypothetical protein AAGN35_08150 [Bacteroidota bacterium]
MSETVMVLSLSDRPALGAVRSEPQLRVAEHGGKIWLRGLPPLAKVPAHLRSLPAQTTYRLVEGDLLFAVGALTPVGTVPDGPWKTLPDYLPVERPVAAMPGKIQQKLPFRLRESDMPRKGEGIVLSLTALKAWIEQTPAHRLRDLKYAVSAHGEALVLGQPLPAQPGAELWRDGWLLLPAGYELEYPALAALISQRLNPMRDGVVRLHPDGTWEKIPWTFLQAVSRSGVRAAFDQINHGSRE